MNTVKLFRVRDPWLRRKVRTKWSNKSSIYSEMVMIPQSISLLVQFLQNKTWLKLKPMLKLDLIISPRRLIEWTIWKKNSQVQFKISKNRYKLCKISSGLKHKEWRRQCKHRLHNRPLNDLPKKDLNSEKKLRSYIN